MPPPAAPSGQTGCYIFQDEFDGPAGSAPDSSKWTVAQAREQIKDPTYWERPESIGQYRDDRRNVFLDGKSNLVLRAAKDGPTYYSGKVQSLWRGGVGHTWEARIKLICLTAGSWPAYWLGNEDQGEIDVMSGTATATGRRPPPSTQKQTAANGRPTTSRWTAAGIRGDASGMRLASGSGKLRRRRATILRRAG